MNMGEIISKIPGVYQASLGNGIVKPVIRGMQGMRVVTLVNGLRIEGQQWGGDHGMGMSQLGVGNIEIIKGPSSLLYGADALGGVLYFNDESFAPIKKTIINFVSEVNSNTLGFSNKFLIKNSQKKVRWLFGVSHMDHADFKLPNRLHALNTRFDELVIKSSFSMNTKNSVHDLRITLNNTHSGIPGNIPISDTFYNSFQIEEQLRSHELPSQYFSNLYISSNHKWFFGPHKIQSLFGFTSNELIEYDKYIESPNLGMNLNNFYHTFKWKLSLSNSFEVVSGIQGMFQQNKNTNLATDQLVPNSYSLDEGLFSIGILKLNKFNFQGGIRYDIRQLIAFNDMGTNENMERFFGGINSSLGMVYKLRKLILRSSISSGFRAPHLTEFLSDGFHMAVLRYEIGDVNLKTENAVQFDFSLEWSNKTFAFTINPFINNIADYIYLQPLDSLIDGIPVFKYQQKKEVTFVGSDFSYHYQPQNVKNLHFEGSFSYVSTIAQEENNVSLIPAPRVQNTISYQPDFKYFIGVNNVNFSHTFMAPQQLVAYNESPSKGYQVFDFSIGLKYDKLEAFDFNLGVKNLLNAFYIDHLSRLKNVNLPSPGRTIYFQCKYNFQNKH